MVAIYKCARKIFITFNSIFWILGLGSLMVGIWCYISKRSYVDMIPSSYGALSAVGLCVVAGITVIIITCVGCFGVWSKSYLLLLSYIFFVMLLLLIQLVVSVLAVNYQADINRRMRLEMKQSLEHYKHRKEVFTSSRMTWDELQATFHCCGVNGPSDWFNNRKWPNNSYVPDSCCGKIHFQFFNFSMENCGKGSENLEIWYHQGCTEVYINWLFEDIKVTAYIAMVFIGIEIILLPLALVILNVIRKKRFSYNCQNAVYHYRKGESDNMYDDEYLDTISLN